MKNASFGDCKQADLHFADQIQSYGALVAIDKRTQRICACSANTVSFVGSAPESLLGQNWSTLFTPAQIESLFKPVDKPGNEVLLIQRTELHQKPVLISNHSIRNITLVEIEHDPSASGFDSFHFSDTITYLHALAATPTVEAAAELLMKKIAAVTQFDRVMLYKFLPEWHGEVIAESLRPGVEGFMGLRFPAGDIPANARRLYLLNWQRAIADVYSEPVPVLIAPNCEPIDFTYSQLRAVHPVHIQYLKNIGTVASFSISIVVAGKLWGLIACHHLAARKPSLAERQFCEQLSHMTSIRMSDMNAIQDEQSRFVYREAQAEIKEALNMSDSHKHAISTQLTRMRQAFNSQGIWAHFDSHDYYSGDIPDDVSLSILKNWLETYDKSDITASSRIHSAFAKYPALVRFASGVMHIPLIDNDFILLMRSEQIETVNWAGNPQALSEESDVLDLTPRSSFQKWSQLVRGVSEPWRDIDIEAAIKLRELLIDHIEKIQLEALALHDPLTKLANRYKFERKLQEAIKLSIQNDSLSAVYMLDLDKFKPVNDTLGHAAGDELLIKVAKRLKKIIRDRDVVARLGGDEFAIIQLHLNSCEDAHITAERILSEISRPFDILNQKIEIGVSIGVAICPFHSTEEHELLTNADLALYRAKHAGRNAFKVFTHNMRSDKQQKESMRLSLTQAMEREEFSFVYQPVVNARTRMLHSFEAFARWMHPEKGMLEAAAFLPLIEQYQLSLQFAEWGIKHLIFQAKQWQRLGLPLAPVSINMTDRQFISLDLPGLCMSAASVNDIGLEWLRFDLEEGALQTGFRITAEKIAALAHLGIMTNIDHFGQGPIALSKIAELKINQLKISGKLFRKDDKAIKNDAMIAIIKSIGKVIQVPVVATQIETDLMESHAIHAGVDYLQGYSISTHLTAGNVEEWLRNKMG
ncbi:MAG: diguanylate cyclase [Nitrosomonas sp.]|nr:diguanylate cyclase [Nitrosomonas sp.]